MGEVEMMRVVKTMNCRMMQQALMYVIVGQDVQTAIESAIEGDINLTLVKARRAGMKV